MRKSLRANAPKRGAAAEPPTRLTPETIERLRDDIVSQRIPLERTSISDDRVTGLRVLIRKTGHVGFHVHYSIGGERPYMLIGHYPEPDELKKHPEAGQEAIDDARMIAHTINELAKQGVDVQDGLHARLIRELRERGTKWRP